MATRPELAVRLEEGRTIVAGTFFREHPFAAFRRPSSSFSEELI
jgi:hypothetical protein